MAPLQFQSQSSTGASRLCCPEKQTSCITLTVSTKVKTNQKKNLNRQSPYQNYIRCKRCDSVYLCLQLSPFSCIRLPMSHIVWLFLLWPSLFQLVNFSTQSRYLVKPVSISKHSVECLAMSAKRWLILLVVINIFWICTGMEKNLTPLVSVFSFLC